MKLHTVTGASGVPISVYETGDPGSPAMVLLHALGENAADWSTVAAALCPDFHMYSVDLRGHGNSGRGGQYTFELTRDDVAAVMDALDLHDIALVGHSMGGVVAYLLAQAQPDRIARLIVEDAPPPYPRDRALPERPEGGLSFDWAAVPAIAGQINDPSRRRWAYLPDITVPTLLIGGGASSHIPQGLLEEVATLIPDCALVTLNVGHNIHRTAPAEFIQAVLTWLDGWPA